MGTKKMEIKKARLTREILTSTDENMINSLLQFLKTYHRGNSPKTRVQDRKLGVLDGKAKIVFADDFEMTTEELISIQ